MTLDGCREKEQPRSDHLHVAIKPRGEGLGDSIVCDVPIFGGSINASAASEEACILFHTIEGR